MNRFELIWGMCSARSTCFKIGRGNAMLWSPLLSYHYGVLRREKWRVLMMSKSETPHMGCLIRRGLMLLNIWISCHLSWGRLLETMIWVWFLTGKLIPRVGAWTGEEVTCKIRGGSRQVLGVDYRSTIPWDLEESGRLPRISACKTCGKRFIYWLSPVGLPPRGTDFPL